MVYVVAQLRAPELPCAWRKYCPNFFEKGHFFDFFENLRRELRSEARTYPNRFFDLTLVGKRFLKNRDPRTPL